jgi:predicted O-linked N-acetylglucosamine transferase (SPINDLY family)
MTERELLRRGLEGHQAGRAREAADCYQQVLRANPANADALYLLAVLSQQTGDFTAAIELARRAIRVSGDQPHLHEALGLALMGVEELEQAEKSLLRAAESGTAESFNNLGILRKKQGRWDEAIAAFERSVERNPQFSDALYNLGNAYREQGQAGRAMELFSRATAANQSHADAFAALGQTMVALGRSLESVVPFRRAIELRPGDAQLRFDAASAFEAIREFADAAECYRAGLAIDGARPEMKHNLGRALFELGRADEALDLFREAAQGLRAALPRAMIAVMIPGAAKATNQEILEARRAFAENDLPPLRPRPARSTANRLRIGYVSSFFHRRNWMKPVWPLIARHDRSRFAVHIFSDAPEAAMPEGYRADSRDRRHDISNLSNGQAARLIEAEGIDLLIDLNGYSKLQRLPLFTLRPAPVTAGWFNMFATTGMSCFDCLIGDDQVIPPEEEEFYCEKILRVPGSYLTFDVVYPVPDVVDPPCLSTGVVTFGCLAPLYKIAPQAITAWSRILRAAPQSSLALRGSALQSEGARRYLLEAFGQCGVSPERIRLYGPAPHFQFLETYNEIDIALDTFPYNGGTTTTEAIWQGVPVVTFYGDRWVSRTSASILRAGNLGRFVNRDLDGYVAQAIELANSRETAAMLRELRWNMRAQLRSSPVCDTEQFAKNMEAIYERSITLAGAEQDR